MAQVRQEIDKLKAIKLARKTNQPDYSGFWYAGVC